MLAFNFGIIMLESVNGLKCLLVYGLFYPIQYLQMCKIERANIPARIIKVESIFPQCESQNLAGSML